MKLSTIRYYLHTYNSLQERIIELTEDLNRYRIMEVENFVFPTAEIDGSKHYKHRKASEVESVSIPRLKHIEKLEQELFRLSTIHSCINAVIQPLDDKSTEWHLLKLRYFEKDRRGRNNTWGWISCRLGYSEQHIRRIDTELCERIQVELTKKIGA